MNVSVIIPVFNEKESLPDLVLELNSSLASYNTWEVIFVDDGSSDGSTEWITNHCESNQNFKLIQFYRNYGKAAALAEGFNHIKVSLPNNMSSFQYVFVITEKLNEVN